MHALTRVSRFTPRKTRFWLICLSVVLVCVYVRYQHNHGAGQGGGGGSSLTSTLMQYTPSRFAPGTNLLYNRKTGTVGIMAPHHADDASFAHAHQDPDTIHEHPIEVLMRRAEVQHKAVQDKLASVVTLADAVRDYEDTWGVPPPLGFDKWFARAREFGTIHVPSLIPESHMPYRHFLPIPAHMIHERVMRESQAEWLYWTTFLADENGVTKMDTSVPIARKDFWGCPEVKDLLEPVAHLIPPPQAGDPDTRLMWSVESYPRRVAAWAVAEKARQYTAEGKMFEEEELLELERKHKGRGFQASCPPDSPFAYTRVRNLEDADARMKDKYTIRADWNYDKPKTFIADVRKAADFCENPDISRMHALLILDTWRHAQELIPLVCHGGVYTSTDNTWAPPMSAYIDIPEVPWSQKTNNRLLWRGEATGMKHTKKTGWRSQQRHRLSYLAHNETGPRTIYAPQAGGGYRLETHDVSDLVEKYTDLGMVGKATFCEERDGTCDELQAWVHWMDRIKPEVSKDYKFIFDIDGHGWSQRFRKELSAGSVVLKSTIFSAWHTSTLIPWYHYVPAKVDYSDLFDIMSFFVGSPDGKVPGRDDLAQKIANRGREYTLKNWKKDDMRNFNLLMVLEYQRIWASDREAAAFRMPLE